MPSMCLALKLRKLLSYNVSLIGRAVALYLSYKRTDKCGSPFKVGDVLVVVLVAHTNDLEQQFIPVF